MNGQPVQYVKPNQNQKYIAYAKTLSRELANWVYCT